MQVTNNCNSFSTFVDILEKIREINILYDNSNSSLLFSLIYPVYWTILFFRSQILSLSIVKIMSQIRSLSFFPQVLQKWATILSWSRSDHSQSFIKIRFTTKICTFRQYFDILFFKNILYQNKKPIRLFFKLEY